MDPQVEGNTRTYPHIPAAALLALVAVVVIVAGVGYMMWHRVFSGPADTRNLVPIVSGRGALPGPRVRPDGVRDRGENRFEIRGGNAVVNVTQRRDQWVFDFTYDDPNMLSIDQQTALTARWRLTRDRAFAKALGVTPEQIKQLEEVPPGGGMIVADTQAERVRTLFDAYVAASPPRTAESTALVSAVREIGRVQHGPTRAAVVDRAEKVRAILKREQIDAFRSGN